MRAAVYHGLGDIRVEQVDAPASVGAEEVLLAPYWCGICGTDLHEYAAGPIVIPTEPHALNGSRAPQILGHEFSAEVVEVGSAVTHLSAGDRVSVMPILACGECYYCRRGLGHLCERMACIGLSDAWGGLAELAVVPARAAYRLPESMTEVQGALVEPMAVAACGVDTAGVRPGDTVLITGGGPIGSLAALYAHALGARVVLSEPNASRRERAAALDVGEVLDPARVDVAQIMRDLTGGHGADAAIECSGNGRALEAAIGAVRSRATITQTGLFTRPAEIDPMQISLRELTYNGTWCYPLHDWPRVIDLISRLELPVERVVTAQVGIDRVVAGFDTLLSPTGDEVKLLVNARG
ncbi:2,3-butanediol dehydrogenase [Leucobacter allii]|uniref:2,3-butanediol dehydrogenase n=1 Tax=Leucobacter allii TaxID=2932247 RepID=UPI001FD12B5A|nr:2,3-butanediol dehydrogenase [Leucobacter allii]UOR01342.1 2,3-butanediol dehydrogenase [Leucobacter allii]